MYENIGKKIKLLANIVALLGIGFCIYYGVVEISDGMKKLGIIVLLAGPVISWISSFVLYGFGQLIENTDKLVKLNEKDSEKENVKISNKEEVSKKLKNASKKKKEDIIKNNQNWNDEIKNLSTEELEKRIEQKEDWQEEYIVLCVIELEKRNKIDDSVEGFV